MGLENAVKKIVLCSCSDCLHCDDYNKLCSREDMIHLNKYGECDSYKRKPKGGEINAPANKEAN